MNIISKIKGCLALAVVAAGFAAWAATVPTDAQGFDYTTDGVTFLPGDYCVVDLTTGKVTEMKDVASAATFNTDDYKTTKMAFRYVPAGKFKAACANTTGYKTLASNDVALSAYWIAVFPVTEAQYNAVMGGETTSVKPKESISWDSFRGGDWTGWDGAYANVPAPGDGTFVKALNDKVAASGCKDKFDLCTSFQWERAARAGTRTDYFFSDKTAAEFGSEDDFPDLYDYAWFAKNFPSIGVQDVGGKSPNAWGLYDVYGNAYERCLDWHEGNAGLVKDKFLEDYAGASSNAYSNRVLRGGHYTSNAGTCSSVFRSYEKTFNPLDAAGFRLIRKPATSSDPSVVPAISAKSEKFTVDLRGEIALAKGEVTVAGVSYSDTAFGAADAADVTLGYTNVGTHVTGEPKTGLSGEGATEVDLPKKNGGYKLTHSTGDLTSFVKFTVSGYPLGSEGNPWEIGANAATEVIAFSNGTDTVTFKPVRGTVTKAGLETITNAMGGASFAAKLIAADGSETNDLVMVLGASGAAYDNIADALAANEASYTLFETKGIPYLDWDDVNKQMTNAMCVVFETYTDQTTLVAGKTYAVMGDITNTTRITVNGTAESPTRLILCDGAKLTAKAGVTVTVSGATTNALIICGQENGTGALEATGSENAAGIGGGNTGAGGIVTINGGIITAMGGKKAAGIGGGLRGVGGIVTINGGTVTATGSSGGVGIGGGMTVTDHGTVTFGEGKTFVVKAGATAAGAAYVTQTAYTNDHSAKYVTLQPGCALKIPEGVNYSYAVTNTTAAMSVPATQVGATNVYAFATNDSYEVTYTPAYGYEWVTAPAANPLTGTITVDTNLTALAVKVRTYIVSYDGNGAAGTMADDTFTMFEQTNLTANAYTAVGYAFAGWTTNGSDEVAYADRAAGVDFAQPGETLALKAKWTNTGAAVATFDALTNALVAATNQAASLPVTVNLTDDITVPQGGVVKVYASPAVTFTGAGKFDVTAEHPALFCGYSVATGLKPEDLGRFVTDKDVKAYYEDGKVVVRGRGETEEFPWLIGTAGHEDEVTAWAGNEMILTKPTRGTASVAALQSVTNALNYVPGLGELKVISADGTATNDVVMLLGSDGVPYDTLADVLAADPMPETVRLFEVKGYFVSYDGNGAAGAMATDTFVPTIPTNLTANAYTAVGYAFEGWTTNGSDKVAYADRAAGVDFAQPGETLALKAKWTDTGVAVATFDALTNALVAATNQAASLPVTVNLTDDITVPQGGVVKVYASPAVTFTGAGKFDISGIPAKYGAPILVGEGFAEGDLDRFDADGVSKPVFEEGKVVLHARGESADFPWVLDGAKGVTAWVDLALTNLAAVVINNGMPMATNAIDLVALTNNLATYGYEPAKTPLNALLAVGKDGGAPEYVKPVNWIGAMGEPYETLEAALAARETVVVPNFVTEEIPEEIVETGTGDDGETYTAVVENVPPDDGVDTPVKAIYAEGLIDLATNEEKNVTLVVETVEESCIPTDDAGALEEANTNGVADVIGYAADYVDLSLYFNEDQQSEIGETLAIHVPWTVNPRQVYRISRIHAGVAEPLPVGEENAVGGEYVEVLADGFIIHAKKYSLYAIGEITLQPRFGIVVGNGGKTLGEPDPSYIATNFTVNVQGLDIEPGDIAGYCVRAKGETAGDYAINFICTRKPQDFDGEIVETPGVFTIRGPEMLDGSGTVTYPAVDKKTGYLKNKANASWTAMPAMGCVFAGWGASDGAPETVTNHLAAFSANELKNKKLTFKVGEGEQIAPTDVEATWARIDEDLIESVDIDTNGLCVVTKSYVTATVSGLPSGLRFNAKTLAISGTVKAKDKTYNVKVSVKNASGYTWKQTFGFTVVNNAVTAIVPADDLVTTGVPVMLWCDPAMGAVKGTGVYALGKDGTKKVSISAVANDSYVNKHGVRIDRSFVFAGWYLDPGFSQPAIFASGKDYRNASQSITVTGPTRLFARFVEKSSNADPIAWLRYAGAGYCGADASVFSEEDEVWYQGVALPTNGCQVAFGSASLPTVTVSGLPSGVKFDKTTLRFTGVPTKASTEKKPFFTVKISVKNKSGATDILLKNVRVEPLPAWAVGNFDGYHIDEGVTNGTFAATVGKTGKVSGKTKGGLADTTFSAKNFSEVFTLDGTNLIYAVDVTVSYKDPVTKKTVKATDTLYLMEDGGTKLGVIGGGDRDGCGSVGVQRAWDRKDLAYPAFDTKALKDPLPLDNGITLKFGAKGKVTVGGTINGVKVSGSTYVMPFAWHSTMTTVNLFAQVPVYVAPKKTALPEGFCEVYDVKLTGGAGADDKFDTVSVASSDIVFTVDGSAGRFFRVIVTDP